AQQQAEAEAQRAAEAEAEAQRAAEEAQQAEPAVEEQPATVTCADGSQAASEAECAAPAQPEEQPVEEQPAQTEEQPAEEVQPTPDPAAPEQTEELPTEEQATGEEVPAEAQPEGEQVLVPAVEPTEDQPVPQITDTRTAEEKEAIAEDPSQTSETVVLPVDNGAAVLDSDKDADNSGGENVRQRRSELRAQEDVAPAPETDADAQSEAVAFDPQTLQATVSEQGTTMDAAPTFEVPTTVTNVTNSTVTNNVTSNVTNNNVTNNTVIQNNVVNQVTEVRVIEQIDNRTVINVGNQIVVRGDDRRRLGYDAQQTYYEQLSRGRTRETIERADGSKLVTVYNRYGDIIIRSRISPGGREYVLMYSPEADGQRPAMYVDVGLSLPPMRLTIPVDDYIVSTTRSPDRDYYDFLARPPVERVERVYSIDEVKSSARIRDKVRRIDLDTITFPSGSAEVPLEQARTLRRVAQAMEKLLENDPGEVFLIEGHTDAVGSDRSNLILSDKRAETVANLLTEVYGIP
ncbi:MAG: OmpA family protein, partial [Allorhizobium sp.]